MTIRTRLREGLLLSPGKFALAKLTLKAGKNKISARARGSDGTRTILYESLTPDQAGAYTLKTDVEIKDEGTYRLSQSLSTDIVVDKDTQTVAGDIMAALKALSEGEGTLVLKQPDEFLPLRR